MQPPLVIQQVFKSSSIVNFATKSNEMQENPTADTSLFKEHWQKHILPKVIEKIEERACVELLELLLFEFAKTEDTIVKTHLSKAFCLPAAISVDYIVKNLESCEFSKLKKILQDLSAQNDQVIRWMSQQAIIKKFVRKKWGVKVLLIHFFNPICISLCDVFSP